MSETTATPEAPVTEAAPAVATPAEAPSKVQLERKKHGPESAAQLIGHLGIPKKDSGHEHAIYEAPRAREGGEPTKGHIWGTLAVNRGEGFDPSWVFYNVYPVENEAGVRPSQEQMLALAETLSKGRRVKMQGPIEVRQGASYEVTVDGNTRNIRDTSVTIKLFWDGTPCPDDAEGSRPITFLPRIGNDNAGPDLGF
jgi:hypothetical protein